MRILVVDDEREHGLLLYQLLERLGHDPLLACDAADALEILDHDDIDVGGIITDIDMPGMSGVQLAEHIRSEIDSELPIAFCTGSDPGSKNTQRAAAIGPVLAKGSPVAETRAVIREMLELWSGKQPRPRR